MLERVNRINSSRTELQLKSFHINFIIQMGYITIIRFYLPIICVDSVLAKRLVFSQVTNRVN